MAMLNISSKNYYVNRIKEYAELIRPDLIDVPDNFQYCICYTSSNGIVGYAINEGIFLYDTQLALTDPYYLINFDNWKHTGIFNKICNWIEANLSYNNVDIDFLNKLNFEASKYLNDKYTFVYEVKSEYSRYNELDKIPL